MKKISVITPSYNRAGMIETAIQSVVDQNYPLVEHIIIDGASSDETLDVLKKYSHLRIISEPDLGMYDALNKGLMIATGEIIGFLNADDFYEPHIFNKIVDLFSKNSINAVAGSAKFFLESSKVTRKDFFQSHPPLPSDAWHDIIIGTPCFNAWFFEKAVFDLIKGFDVNYKIAGDRDLLLRFALSGMNYKCLEEVVYHYRYHSGSLSMNQDWLYVSKVINENLTLINHYLDDPRMPDLAYKLLLRLRTRETITAASRASRSGNWQQAISYSSQGFRSDYFWPVKFALRAFIGIARNIVGRFKALPPQIQ